jgi:protein HEXIM1/2
MANNFDDEERRGGDADVKLATAEAPSGGTSNYPDYHEKKKKTRRRKPKRKNPYQKEGVLPGRRNKGAKKGLNQPVAPYNSNQFLIEDHNDLQDFDVKLLDHPHRPARVRDSSFTSADSDEDFFYSSPEDEEEFLTKEFSNTYQDLHVESLAQMSKTDLIQQVLQLEEKVDLLEKRLETKSRGDKADSEIVLVDKVIKFQQEISKLALANEELQHENEKLRREKQGSSVSSIDSESDSSTSSGSSDLSCHQNGSSHLVNGDTDTNMDTDSAR